MHLVSTGKICKTCCVGNYFDNSTCLIQSFWKLKKKKKSINDFLALASTKFKLSLDY